MAGGGTYHGVVGPLLHEGVLENLPQVRVVVPREPRDVVHERDVVEAEEGVHVVQPLGQDADVAVPELADEHEVVAVPLAEQLGPLVDEVPRDVLDGVDAEPA